MYSFCSRIRYSEVNKVGILTPSAIINYLQDCSLFHSEEVGLGPSYFEAHKKAWVLSSWQLEIIRSPKLFENITVSTYPYNIKGFMGYRNFTITDEHGDICVMADSSWVYMNMETLRPVRIALEEAEKYGIDDKLDMDYKRGKILLPESIDKHEPFPVLPSYIDSNNHVNNDQYVKFAENYLPEHFHPTSIRVEYRNAAKIDDIIYPLVHTTDTVCTISLADAEELPFAVMEFVS